MISGDPYLRRVDPQLALRYASHLAKRLDSLIDDVSPAAILGSHDRIHAGIALAVARLRGIPFVALTFSSVPQGLVAFSKALNPSTLVPIERKVGADLQRQARRIVSDMRKAPESSVTFRPSYAAPRAFRDYVRWWARGASNYVQRTLTASRRGVAPFSAPRARHSVAHRLRRSWNRVLMPRKSFIHEPPAGPYVFHTLHLAPESTVDSWAPWYQDQIALVKLIAMSTPVDLSFVVKLHYADPDNYSRAQLRELTELKGVLVASPDSRSFEFIAEASLVTGITGTACLEAALLGKPVVMFGDSPYLEFPRTERAERPANLPGQISRMLSSSEPSEDAVVAAYERYLARYMPGTANDWTVPISAEGRRNIALAFAALAQLLQSPDVVGTWYDDYPFDC